MRLDGTPHLPVVIPDKSKKSLRCQLHRWADRSYEFKEKIMVCGTCNVSLCLHCYKEFHTLKHKDDLKKHVKAIVEKYDHCKASRGIKTEK